MSIDLGFGLITCQRYPGDDRSDTEIYAQAIELAAQAETRGLDSVWVSEHHFVDDGYLPSLLPMCAAIAARTSRVLIGTGLLLAPLHHPLRLAEDAAVTDLIAGGRLVLGLGLGWREEEFKALGVPLAERVPRLLGTIGVLRGAWRGDLVPGGQRQDGRRSRCGRGRPGPAARRCGSAASARRRSGAPRGWRTASWRPR